MEGNGEKWKKKGEEGCLPISGESGFGFVIGLLRAPKRYIVQLKKILPTLGKKILERGRAKI